LSIPLPKHELRLIRNPDVGHSACRRPGFIINESGECPRDHADPRSNGRQVLMVLLDSSGKYSRLFRRRRGAFCATSVSLERDGRRAAHITSCRMQVGRRLILCNYAFSSIKNADSSQD